MTRENPDDPPGGRPAPPAGDAAERAAAVVRLSDVARLARCSTATVSRVLNGLHSVTPEVRARVEAAVSALGYTRNGAARALRSRRSGMVGVILPTVRQPIFADLVDALQDSLAQQGHSLIVSTVGYAPEAELRQARTLVERGIDGLVLMGQRHPQGLHDLLHARAVASVFLYTLPAEANRPTVGYDDGVAAERIVGHLCGLGHRDVAVLSGVVADSDRTEARVRGLKAALLRRGIALPPARHAENQPSIAGGRAGLRALLRAPRRPTAVACTSDLVAIGALYECTAQGIAVPADMSITGYDDIETAAQVIPALTTVSVSAAEMGRRAADHLLARLGGRPCPDQILVESRLVVRDSAAAPPGAAPFAPPGDSEVS